MAEVVWTEPALADLEAIADCIAIENPAAAGEFVLRVFARAGKFELDPLLGSVPSEIEQSRYRQMLEPPCRIFYRHEEESVFIVNVMRSERVTANCAFWLLTVRCLDECSPVPSDMRMNEGASS